MKKSKETDLQKFIRIFQTDKYKTIKTGIEVRGAVDLEKTIADARKVIDKNGLNLKVVSNADMATYKAFEVQNAI